MLLAPALSLIVLAAHFVRAGSTVAALPVGVLALLAVRRRWAARVVQIVLTLGAIEWFFTLLDDVKWRALSGEPVLRLVIILGAVTVFTAASALVFRSAALRTIYRPRAARVSARGSGA